MSGPGQIGNGGTVTDDDDLTPPEAQRFHVANPAHEALVYILADLALETNRLTQGIDSLRVEVAARVDPIGSAELDKLTDRFVAAAGSIDKAADKTHRVANAARAAEAARGAK